MKLTLDPMAVIPPHVTAESEALSEWYDAHPIVRRLWAIRKEHDLSVFVTLEPTVDNDDTSPAWLACSGGWTGEIQSVTGSDVRMALLDEPGAAEIDIDVEGELIAALNWRDPTSFWKAD
ncbi:MAG TPA: hypothetical protein VKB34_18995 [Povalibacter sp.]|nr:hypothetical protein [Povalibacter sp.]